MNFQMVSYIVLIAFAYAALQMLRLPYLVF